LPVTCTKGHVISHVLALSVVRLISGDYSQVICMKQGHSVRSARNILSEYSCWASHHFSSA